MYTPIPDQKLTAKAKKKHFFQKHPVIGRFFEAFGCLAWPIIIILVAALVMFLVPEWRPTLYVILHKIANGWNYFWGELLPQCFRWDWNEAQPKK
ncbi:MAG TPA: hypothetical protein PL110_04280 [Candidatus Eremiobacteraeota bacterium]|nr:MAG: hypothetical protein BWY64_01094 [bacterium ADurb.Bin363]HPZ07305.1 hypothetical protein [Candidatus Eremiobacteraeota bacterium]